MGGGNLGGLRGGGGCTEVFWGERGGEGPGGPRLSWADLSSSADLSHLPFNGQPRSSCTAGRANRLQWNTFVSSWSAPSRSKWTRRDACWSWRTVAWSWRWTPPTTCSPLPGKHRWPGMGPGSWSRTLCPPTLHGLNPLSPLGLGLRQLEA